MLVSTKFDKQINLYFDDSMNVFVLNTRAYNFIQVIYLQSIFGKIKIKTHIEHVKKKKKKEKNALKKSTTRIA